MAATPKAPPKKRRGRPSLPVGGRVRDRKQLNLRPDAEVLSRFQALREEHGLRPEALFSELVALVPGKVLDYVFAMADHQEIRPGDLIRRLVAQEWSSRGYSWRREQ